MHDRHYQPAGRDNNACDAEGFAAGYADDVKVRSAEDGIQGRTFLHRYPPVVADFIGQCNEACLQIAGTGGVAKGTVLAIFQDDHAVVRLRRRHHAP